MRGVTRLCWAGAHRGFGVAAGCGGTGQTARSDERLDEQNDPAGPRDERRRPVGTSKLDTPDVVDRCEPTGGLYAVSKLSGRPHPPILRHRKGKRRRGRRKESRGRPLFVAGAWMCRLLWCSSCLVLFPGG